MVAERTFLRCVGFGVDEAAPVGTRLHAVAAAEAITFVDEDDAIGGDEGRANGADLGARGIGAVVAELRDKEVLAAGVLVWREALLAAVGGLNFGALDLPVGNVVALDPGAVVAIGDIIFFGAGADTAAAADALRNVDQHAPPVISGLVVGGSLGRTCLDVLPGDGGSGQEHEEATAGDVHYFFLASVAGLASALSSILGR